MNKRVKDIGLILLSFIFFSGCSVMRSPVELIGKPKVTSKKIKEDYILSEILSKEETLTLALSQKEMESIRSVDLDKDGKDELIVLFKENKEVFRGENKYGIIILKQLNGKWHEINRIYQKAYGVDLVECKDVTGDKKPDIIVGWNMNKEDEKLLNVYSWSEGYFHFVYKDVYKEIGIDDLDSDGKNELILLKKVAKTDAISVEVFKYFNEKINNVDKFIIRNKNYYNTMKIGNVINNNKGIFIDFDMGTLLSYTDLLVMKNNKLVDVFKNESLDKPKTLKRSFIKSKDVNNDGIVEIGLTEKLSYPVKDEKTYHSINKNKLPVINGWYQWNGKEGIDLVLREYCNYDLGYKIIIPEKWGNEFTISVSYEENSEVNKVEFFSLDSKQGIENHIFSIESMSKNQWNNSKDMLKEKKYIVLKDDENNVILSVLPDNKDKNDKYFIDEDNLRKSFYTIKKGD
ncbi:VCBS repeat-containing protein [Clostridium sp. MB40-C1]|uniref:FG-GAP repeat domain-containing protein n=1 Tax=Clostridium sp. MB40-C1 TaxID=3070996 RepID=UPI0027DFF01C|nr:VCBS repeat-containing protein [Clostridium sp. MB40-C1]WMJ80483.1 VCBS repeat-containing protein [Clostridium sp. MB40-C1]